MLQKRFFGYRQQYRGILTERINVFRYINVFTNCIKTEWHLKTVITLSSLERNKTEIISNVLPKTIIFLCSTKLKFMKTLRWSLLTVVGSYSNDVKYSPLSTALDPAPQNWLS